MIAFTPFDPLAAKQVTDTEVAINALKKEIDNILSSYVGWYDPFAELIQNALDSVEERDKEGQETYTPTIWIKIDLLQNQLSVTDNGIGLDKPKFEQFLAPSFSFKSGTTRGHKGVGATYLAYGFNYMQICTKTDDYAVNGKMVNARKWLTDPAPASNPKVSPDSNPPVDEIFNDIDRGVSITLKFDKTTTPKQLSWIQADTAEKWLKILSVKTGLGAFFENKKIVVNITVINNDRKITALKQKGIRYLWPHDMVTKSASFRQIDKTEDNLYKRHGKDFRRPSSIDKLEAFYDVFNVDELRQLITLNDEEEKICQEHNPTIYFSYMYTAKAWTSFTESLNLRTGVRLIYGGIQIAANNMPQGEIFPIPLTRDIGRQNQVHFVIHFENCKADLGRKGFQLEIKEFCKSITQTLVRGPFTKKRSNLKPTSGVKPNLSRQRRIEEWKDEMENHEKDNPLTIKSQSFFLPTNQISMTSAPTREQDVIALFNQLLAGGVIRGIKVMSTNERFTYDGLYRVSFDGALENHIYDQETNPLGILTLEDELSGYVSKPRVLEYKFSLDGLIENLEDGSKNTNDIGLLIAWETGDEYLGNYLITSLLDKNNINLREYHGVTHVLTNIRSGQAEVDLIILKELIEYLNNPIEAQIYQVEKYDQY